MKQYFNPTETESNSTTIFDDIGCEKHYNMPAYFTMMSYSDIDSFCLGKSYTGIPIHLTRDNANLVATSLYKSLSNLFTIRRKNSFVGTIAVDQINTAIYST